MLTLIELVKNCCLSNNLKQINTTTKEEKEIRQHYIKRTKKITSHRGYEIKEKKKPNLHRKLETTSKNTHFPKCSYNNSTFFTFTIYHVCDMYS